MRRLYTLKYDRIYLQACDSLLEGFYFSVHQETEKLCLPKLEIEFLTRKVMEHQKLYNDIKN